MPPTLLCVHANPRLPQVWPSATTMTNTAIVEYPDPILRQIAEPVIDFDSNTHTLVAHLIDTLNATSGIGLCAPQIGQAQQVLVMDLSADKSQPEVLINPEIIKTAGFAICAEQCLSIPGIVAKIMRPSAVLFKAKNQHGESLEREYTGMHAICLQHEIDHLQGKLFIDRVSRIRSLLFRNTLRSLQAGKPSLTASTYNPS